MMVRTNINKRHIVTRAAQRNKNKTLSSAAWRRLLSNVTAYNSATHHPQNGKIKKKKAWHRARKWAGVAWRRCGDIDGGGILPSGSGVIAAGKIISSS